ncbi:hypothetical protein FGO68_gene3290 [Halteria grandinella]|uniref:non-specific serine/threonine protein kinase n=1 Tax=Halteria grandinella TaxID=5974 RepID=A0A8J8T6F3_HALGN|nr:hypothetical protein FGO68_gene3290 [Halteria grandinella]
MGLAKLHAKKFIHRDLKPGNIFLVGKHVIDYGIAKIGDLGLATCLDQSRYAENHGTGIYFPPEYFQNPHANALSYESDIWALGVILYELASNGRFPFALKAEGKYRKIQQESQVIDAQYIPLPNSVDPEVCKLVSLILKKDPINRPSIQQIIKEDIVFDIIQSIAFGSLLGNKTASAYKEQLKNMKLLHMDRADISQLANGSSKERIKLQIQQQITPANSQAHVIQPNNNISQLNPPSQLEEIQNTLVNIGQKVSEQMSHFIQQFQDLPHAAPQPIQPGVPSQVSDPSSIQAPTSLQKGVRHIQEGQDDMFEIFEDMRTQYSRSQLGDGSGSSMINESQSQMRGSELQARTQINQQVQRNLVDREEVLRGAAPRTMMDQSQRGSMVSTVSEGGEGPVIESVSSQAANDDDDGLDEIHDLEEEQRGDGSSSDDEGEEEKEQKVFGQDEIYKNQEYYLFLLVLAKKCPQLFKSWTLRGAFTYKQWPLAFAKIRRNKCFLKEYTQGPLFVFYYGQVQSPDIQSAFPGYGKGIRFAYDSDKNKGGLCEMYFNEQGYPYWGRFYVYSNGEIEVYTGEFRNSTFANGRGYMDFASKGYTIEGSFLNGKAHGQCIRTNLDGERSMGEYKEGRQHGTHKRFTTSGKVFVQLFHEGVAVSGEEDITANY